MKILNELDVNESIFLKVHIQLLFNLSIDYMLRQNLRNSYAKVMIHDIFHFVTLYYASMGSLILKDDIFLITELVIKLLPNKLTYLILSHSRRLKQP